MDMTTAREIVAVLADGIDPESGEAFETDSPYNQPRVVRALFTLLEGRRGRTRAKMSLDERRQANLDNGRPRNFGLPWTEEARSELKTLYSNATPVNELARRYERSRTAIVSELVRQDLIDPKTLQPKVSDSAG